MWLTCEIAVRVIAGYGLPTDFYGSEPPQPLQDYQTTIGIKTVQGLGWTHLGWIADPKLEYYLLEICQYGQWQVISRTEYGSFLYKGLDARLRVLKVNRHTARRSILGEVVIVGKTGEVQAQELQIIGNWKPIFKPSRYGDYINDHSIYLDKSGTWRLIGITSHGAGDYNKEKYFSTCKFDGFPPTQEGTESEPLADFGELAWAPQVLVENNNYHLFWSPHKLHHMVSTDGRYFSNHQVVIERPYHKYFRDAYIIKVSENQYLLYATSRGKYFSRIDIYQSFDLKFWQYIRPALRSTWGSERNFVTGSMESPKVMSYKNGYYLSTTYNNGSTFLSALFLELHLFLDKKSYNDTLVFFSTNPYDFGIYSSRKSSRSLVSSLQAHAPNYVQVDDRWYITTSGWPFAATLTEGEVALAELSW